MIAAETARALYVVSKRAKQRATAAEDAYEAQKYAIASKESNEKERLYTLKANALQELQGDVDRIERHRIDGSRYYCFYFTDSDGEQWSFHAPINAVALGEDTTAAAEQELDAFDASESFERVAPRDMTVDAEQTLRNVVGLEARLQATSF